MPLNTVTIIDVSGTPTDSVFREGETLGGLLNYLGYDTSNVNVRVNDVQESMSYELEAGDEIRIEPLKVKSGS